jgi:hypothetical protein
MYWFKIYKRHSLSQMKAAGLAQSKNQTPGWLPLAPAASGGSVWCSTRPHTLLSLSGTYCWGNEVAERLLAQQQQQQSLLNQQVAAGTSS